MMTDQQKSHRPTEAEMADALAAATKALDEMALESALTPDAQHARDLCHNALGRMQRVDTEKTLGAAIEKASHQEAQRDMHEIARDRGKE